MIKSYSWFKKRINKRIYRDTTPCGCSTCKDVEKKGIVIRDENHAQYLAMVSADMNIEYREK